MHCSLKEQCIELVNSIKGWFIRIKASLIKIPKKAKVAKNDRSSRLIKLEANNMWDTQDYNDPGGN